MIKNILIAAAVFAVVGGLYLFAQQQQDIGRSGLVEKLNGDKVKVIIDGKEIDKKVDGYDVDGLCAALGGCG